MKPSAYTNLEGDRWNHVTLVGVKPTTSGTDDQCAIHYDTEATNNSLCPKKVFFVMFYCQISIT